MDYPNSTDPKFGAENTRACRDILMSSRTSTVSDSSSCNMQGFKSFSRTSGNLIAKKPKIIQKYLSLLLKGTGNGTKAHSRFAKDAHVQFQRRVPRQKLFTVPSRWPEELQNNPLVHNISKHHIENQVQVILQSGVKGSDSDKARSSKGDESYSAGIGRSDCMRSDSKRLIKQDVQRGVFRDENRAVGKPASLPAVAKCQNPSPDMKPSGSEHSPTPSGEKPHLVPSLDNAEVREHRGGGSENISQKRGMEQYLKTKSISSIGTSHYSALSMAPPIEKRIHFPIGLSPEETQKYIRLLIKAKRSCKRATTTPTAPYSSTDLIGSYNNDTNQFQDDLRIGNGHSHGGIDSDRPERRRSRDIVSDRRPPSRKDSKKTLVITSREGKGGTDSLNDRQREAELGSTGIASVTSGGLTQKNFFKPLASRSTFVRNSITSPTPRPSTNGPTPNSETTPIPRGTPLTGRESEDTLVAMGTNWNPSNAFQRNNGRPGSFSNGMANGNGNHGYHLAHQLSISQAPTTMTRQLAKRNTVPHLSSSRPSIKDGEPKYGDPTMGAPASFQQRLIEMSALESETIRWERTRKFQKKKPRSET